MQVYCQIDKSIPKGWLVFQRRLDGSVDFKRDWATYKTGFGNLSGEFWMGLEKIHQLSYQEPLELRVELEDWDGNMRYAEYSGFYVDTEAANYRLRFFGYSAGDAGDSLKAHNGIAFATIDRDDSAKCANTFKSGWWFTRCHFANLNGLYNVGGTCARLEGINWDTWRGLKYSHKKARMMMVPTG
ncbi:predicted protein [Nematostella vectensis]|uniref:Fibrinogen C-terminal domain-containing protein n=1 Tax=Nematostella vectensis TaxID=45351 RepID=A7SCM6_NEMVE|nr:predicted protein [Nematostella vectensis]|eukprot:XP_001630608.1 predicted protein [Nematostella vectensis]